MYHELQCEAAECRFHPQISFEYPYSDATHRDGVLQAIKRASCFHENWEDPAFMATKTLCLQAGDLAAR